MNPDILQMLMGALTQSPPGPGGDVPDATPAGAVPPAVLNGSPTAELNAMLQQIIQMVVASQSAQASMNGVAGMQGGMYGGMGGRPPAEMQRPNPGLEQQMMGMGF